MLHVVRGTLPSLVARCVAARYVVCMSSTRSVLHRKTNNSLLTCPNHSFQQLKVQHHRQQILHFHSVTRKNHSVDQSLSKVPSDNPESSHGSSLLHHEVPHRIRQKVVSASDAVALVRNGDTVFVSGFVTQGCAEAVLKALGERFEATSSPSNLTLLFGGGPGDYGERGLSHLAKIKGDVRMLRRTIGGHYGQVPKVSELALADKVEAWTLPMGSISRMVRAQSTHSPGHITNVGLGTYVDPAEAGCAVNESARNSPLNKKLVTRIDIDGQVNLMYKALPINVAIIRGTTADSEGNITLEHESLLCDQKIAAAAAKNSGGIVIAQVKRLAANNSLPSRSVGVPGPLVDCVVVVDEKDHVEMHGMSYVENYNPSLTGEIRTPKDQIKTMPFDVRKIIARRAFLYLEPDKIVNLGIGLPEGVASVAAEENFLKYVTLSTEPGVFGGIPASGHNFGPAYNASSQVEMNDMFDFYDGGILDMCILGAAQISKNGDVNVSRMSKDRLIGPGGFINISQCTRNVCFVMPFTVKGLEIDVPGDGTLKVIKEGQVKKFVDNVFEKTFSGDEAVRRGQKVLYITERAVFRRSGKSDVLELVEIAAGIDLQKDVLDQMEFTPIINPNLRTMDSRIFKKEKMNVLREFFGSLEDRCIYHASDHIMYLDLIGITLSGEEDVNWLFNGLRNILSPLVKEHGPIDMVINYDGFDLRQGLEELYGEHVNSLEKEMYRSVKRYSGRSFRRAKLGQSLQISDWDLDELFDKFDVNHDGTLSPEEIRNGMRQMFQIHLTPSQMSKFQGIDSKGPIMVDRKSFAIGFKSVLETSN